MRSALTLIACVTLCLFMATAQGADYIAPSQLHMAFTGNTTEMLISWHTSLDTPSHVLLYYNANFTSVKTFVGNSSTYLPSAGYDHHVVVTGLEHDTVYQYQAGSAETGWSINRTFTAPPMPGRRSNFSVAMYGDMGIENSQQTIRVLTDLVEDNKISWVYHAGDYSYGNDRAAEQYELSWDAFMGRLFYVMPFVPYMTAVGNHEYSCSKTDCESYSKPYVVYNHRFKMPYASSGAVNNLWFSFDYANAHFISISTETDYPGAPTSTQFGDQLGWLEKDLQKAQADKSVDWIIAVGHRPMYSSYVNKSLNGYPINQQESIQAAFENLFHKYGVDVYLDGHVHAYERTYPVYRSQTQTKGITHNKYVDPTATSYICAGAAGNTEGHYTDWQPNPPDWSAHVFDLTFGLGVFEFAGNSELRWTWYRATDNNYEDWFVIHRSNGKNWSKK